MIGRPKRLMEFIFTHVVCQLLHKFGQLWKVRDRAIVIWNVEVQVMLFKNGCELGIFEMSGDRTRFR